MTWFVRKQGGRILGRVSAGTSTDALDRARHRWPGRDTEVFNHQATADTTSCRDWWMERGY